MKTIKFNISTREVTIESGRSVINTDASVQNAGIILESRASFSQNPLIGIGFSDEIAQGNQDKAIYELDRWKGQVLADGAEKVNYAIVPNSNPIQYTIDAKY